MRAKIERISWLKESKGSTRAFVDIKFHDAMIVKGFKIMDGQNGQWLAMPSQKGKDEKWFPTVVFSDKETQQGFQDHILKQATPQDHGGTSSNPGGASSPEEIAWNE